MPVDVSSHRPGKRITTAEMNYGRYDLRLKRAHLSYYGSVNIKESMGKELNKGLFDVFSDGIG